MRSRVGSLVDRYQRQSRDPPLEYAGVLVTDDILLDYLMGSPVAAPASPQVPT